MTLRQKMEATFDPSDTDRAQSLAYNALKLMRLMQQAIDDDNKGLRLGRDQKDDMFSAIYETAVRLGLLDSWANGEEVGEFLKELRLG